jgi:hypothetical protein
MIDYTKILNYKYADSQWTLNGNDYEGLTWLSDTTKPSKSTLDGLWKEVQDLIKAEVETKIQKKIDLLKKLNITEAELELLLA